MKIIEEVRKIWRKNLKGGCFTAEGIEKNIPKRITTDQYQYPKWYRYDNNEY